MSKFVRPIVSLVLSFIFIFSFSLPQAFAEGPTLQYVALGDSLAEGYLNSGEMGDGYPIYIAQGIEDETLYEVNLTNYGVGGFTTVHVLQQLEQADVQQNIAQADIITIDIGANDILWEIGTDFDLSDPHELLRILQVVENAISTVRTNVGEIMSQINQLNPDAPVFFMGYYNALPYLDGQENIQLMMGILNDTLQQVSESDGAIFVPTYDSFHGMHDIYLPNPNDIHPTKEGYEVIADLFLIEILPILPPQNSIPELTLHGDNPMELEVGDTYVEPGASAFDSIDGDLTDQIEIIGEVNTNEAGIYTITYRVTNRLGEVVSVERTIRVVEVREDVEEDERESPSQQEEKITPPSGNDHTQTPREQIQQEPTAETAKSTTGDPLPKTATTYPSVLLIGILLAITGSSFIIARSRMAGSNKT